MACRLWTVKPKSARDIERQGSIKAGASGSGQGHGRNHTLSIRGHADDVRASA